MPHPEDTRYTTQERAEKETVCLQVFKCNMEYIFLHSALSLVYAECSCIQKKLIWTKPYPLFICRLEGLHNFGNDFAEHLLFKSNVVF